MQNTSRENATNFKPQKRLGSGVGITSKITVVIRNQEHQDKLAKRIMMLSVEYPIKITLEPYKKSRSLAQNSLYWLWLSKISRDYGLQGGQFYIPDIWHIQFRKMFLGYKTKELPNGEIEKMLISTADLSTMEFMDYLNNIEMYAGSELNIILPHPDDLWHEAMNVQK